MKICGLVNERSGPVYLLNDFQVIRIQNQMNTQNRIEEGGLF
jgi:hypothetical protein